MRSPTRAAMVSRFSVPVSRYSSRAASSRSAALSNSASSGPPKSTQPSSSRRFSSASSRSRSAPAWSILLTKRKTGTPYRSSSRHRVSVWLCTPSAPLMTSTAQSSTRSTRSVSAEKSAWPGVSTRVSSAFSRGRMACLAKMVMPRSRSMGSVSRKASRWSTRPSFRSRPPR